MNIKPSKLSVYKGEISGKLGKTLKRPLTNHKTVELRLE